MSSSATRDLLPESFAVALELKRKDEDLSQFRAGAVCALVQLLDLKDLKTGIHCTRLAERALRVGERLGLQDEALEGLEVASLLHDIGKVGVPDALLNKPGRLTSEEFEVVSRHPEYGWSILRLLPGMEAAALAVLHHHERMDGRGYPTGLRGEEIPLSSRIVAVLDAFDAMLSDRSYRRRLPLEEAIRRLRSGIGTQFDCEVSETFLELVQEEPELLDEPWQGDLLSSAG